MDKEEIKKIRKLNYLDLCSYLKTKYGCVTGNYFVNENCKTPNSKIKRTEDGLSIHHIMENTYKDLSKPQFAKEKPYSYQEKENLVYCNVLEHLILHIDIVKEYLTRESVFKNHCMVGLGGVVNFLIPQINDFYTGYSYKRIADIKKFEIIKDNKEDYFDIIYDFEKYTRVSNMLGRFPELKMMEPTDYKNPLLYNLASLTIVNAKDEGKYMFMQNNELLNEYNSWRIRTYLPKYRFLNRLTNLKDIYDKYHLYVKNSFEEFSKYLEIDNSTGYIKYLGPRDLNSSIRQDIDMILYYVLTDNIVEYVEDNKDVE